MNAARGTLLALILFLLPAAALAQGTSAGENLVTEATVHEAVTAYVMQKAAHLNAEVNVKRIGFRGDLKLPPGRVSFEVVAPERWQGYGNTSVALVVRVDDQVKRNQTVLVEVEALAEVLVAARALERGEVLAASDLALVRRDLAQMHGSYLKSPDDAVGLRLKTTVRANSPLRKDQLERMPIVKNGQMVTILAENDVVRITASGRAKGSGAMGDTITVQNLASQRELPARVVDANTVQVDF